MGAGAVVSPDNNFSAVAFFVTFAVAGCIGLEACRCRHHSVFCVGHRCIFALVIATDQNSAAAVAAGGVYAGTACHLYLLAQHLHGPAMAPQGRYIQHTADPSCAAFQPNHARVFAQRKGPHDAGVVDAACAQAAGRTRTHQHPAAFGLDQVFILNQAIHCRLIDLDFNQPVAGKAHCHWPAPPCPSVQ